MSFRTSVLLRAASLLPLVLLTACAGSQRFGGYGSGSGQAVARAPVYSEPVQSAPPIQSAPITSEPLPPPGGYPSGPSPQAGGYPPGGSRRARAACRPRTIRSSIRRRRSRATAAGCSSSARSSLRRRATRSPTPIQAQRRAAARRAAARFEPRRRHRQLDGTRGDRRLLPGAALELAFARPLPRQRHGLQQSRPAAGQRLGLPRRRGLSLSTGGSGGGAPARRQWRCMNGAITKSGAGLSMNR
jgi:hypothetical protein